MVSDVDKALRVPISAALAATRAFEDMTVQTVEWTDAMTVPDAVQRMASHSSHRVLDAEVATALDEALTDELGGPTATIELAYTTRVFVADRLS